MQIKLRGDHGPSAFAQGRTLRGGPSAQELRFVSQEITGGAQGGTSVATTLEHPGGGLRARFILE